MTPLSVTIGHIVKPDMAKSIGEKGRSTTLSLTPKIGVAQSVMTLYLTEKNYILTTCWGLTTEGQIKLTT